MTTFDQVLHLAQQLPPVEQARLRAALQQADDAARVVQIRRNQAAIALLDSWAAAEEADDGTESWEAMLQQLDHDRESSHVLYPQLIVPERSA